MNHTTAITYKNRWYTLGVLCLSLMVVMIGNTALNVALPSLARDLSASTAELQWMVDAYSLVFAGMLFAAGAIGDRYGRKGILQTGLILFGLASLYAGIGANTAIALIATRAVMGFAGAMIMPATLSILTNIFPAEERAKAVGTWSGVSGAAVAFGPLLSGWMLEHYSWHSVFLINLPFIVLALLAGLFLVPKSADPKHTSLDIPGALLSFIGLSAVVYALIEAPVNGWLSPETLATAAGGLVFLGIFAWWESRNTHPMLDVRLFTVPAFGVSSLALILVFFALMGLFFNLSQLLQLVLGYSPLQSAVRMLPVAGAVMVSALSSAGIIKRFGTRRPVAVGMLMVALGIFLLSRIPVDAEYMALLGGMIIAALGMGVVMSPTTDMLMSAVPRNRAGMGSAMNDTTRELGASLGIAVLGSLLASAYSSKMAPVVAQLPDSAKEVAKESLAGAVALAQQLGPLGEPVMQAAREAWMTGFQNSLVIAAIIIAITAAITYIGLPERALDHTQDRDE